MSIARGSLVQGGVSSIKDGAGTDQILAVTEKNVFVTGVWFKAGGNGNGATVRGRNASGIPMRLEGAATNDISVFTPATPIGPFNGLEAVFTGSANDLVVSWIKP